MRVIGFHFKKISVEKFKEPTENLSIKTGMELPKIKEIEKGVLKTKEDLLEVSFEYNLKYEPDFAKIEFGGVILVSVDPKTSKNILKNWKKKEIPKDMRIYLINVILRKSTLKALELEDELNLPLHLPMPSLKRDQEGK